jgi:hypothetical protein
VPDRLGDAVVSTTAAVTARKVRLVTLAYDPMALPCLAGY